MRLICFACFIHRPDTRKLGMSKDAMCRSYLLIFEHKANCFRHPIWFEHNKIAELIIIMKVKDLAQIMQIAAQSSLGESSLNASNSTNTPVSFRVDMMLLAS